MHEDAHQLETPNKLLKIGVDGRFSPFREKIAAHQQGQAEKYGRSRRLPAASHGESAEATLQSCSSTTSASGAIERDLRTDRRLQLDRRSKVGPGASFPTHNALHRALVWTERSLLMPT